MYRNEWEAAVARASALEAELRRAQDTQAGDHQQIANLQAQLNAARADLARLQSMAAQPPAYPPPGYPPAGYAPPGYGYYAQPSYIYQSRHATILVLGILSLVVCSIMGPIAWAMGNEELRRMDGGQTSPEDRGAVQAGRICGMIASILMIVAFVFIVFVMMAASSR